MLAEGVALQGREDLLELGFPWFLHYQHLPHLVVVLLQRLLFGLPDLRTLFDVVRYLLLLGLPLTVYWTMRTMGFSRAAGAVAGAAATLLSGAHRGGFEYDSYVWRGFGGYTHLRDAPLLRLARDVVSRRASRNRDCGGRRRVVSARPVALHLRVHGRHHRHRCGHLRRDTRERAAASRAPRARRRARGRHHLVRLASVLSLKRLPQAHPR